MTDYFLPPSVDIARTTIRYMDSTAVSRNPYNGAVRTASLLGDRLGLVLEVSPSGGRGSSAGLQDRARIMQFVASLRGQQNRAYLYDPGYVQRGSFPSSELIPNNDFASGTTGWSSGGAWTIAASDGFLRSSRNASAAAASILRRTGNISGLTQFAAYGMRFLTVLGAGLDPATLTARVDDSGVTLGPVLAWAALRTGVQIPYGTQLNPSFVQVAPAAIAAGAFVDTLYTSMARCIVADNSPNLALQSDVFDNASWTKSQATITANAGTAPDGTATADSIVEAATTNTHYAEQSFTVAATALDYTASCCFLAGARTWGDLQLIENTGTTVAHQWLNLSTGALGTGSVGTNWSNLRASVTPLGSGWYRLSVTATKTNAATVIRIRVSIANADAATSYTGDGTSNILVWRAGLMQGGFAFAPAQTTTVTSSGVAPSGNSINVKALPASTAGLLLPGDQVEILSSYGSELKIVTAALDSDGNGLGTLFFAPRVRGTVSDGAAIVTCRPMGRFVYASQGDMEWNTEPGIITTANFEFEEAVG